MAEKNIQPPQQAQGTSVKKFQEDTIQQVLVRINAFKESGELRLPKDYSPENAIKSAWLILQEAVDKNGKPVLEVCTKTSIANALLKMVTLGLSPMKKQCDFIAYGNRLSCDMEYAGNIALAKRYGGLKWIRAKVITKEDEAFEFENDTISGTIKVTNHKQTLDSIGSKNIIGAYAVYCLNDGTVNTEIMNMNQIQASWNQGAMKGNSPSHRNFPDQMAIKTVINRVCKLLIRGSDDSVLMYDDDSDAPRSDAKMETVKQEIKDNANKQVIGMDEEPEDIPHEETKNIDKSNNQKSELFTDDKPDF